ncbi:MAG: rane protein of glp regulon GlpG [Chitinophagaceae bacterium]|jgi:membrane associated rhomboid family serine protease|nr:rane protein of glp regulon GlpG [Chitinophagaceae bacterium]
MTQFRPSRFEILPPVIKNLVIINGLMFLAQQTIKSTVFGSLEDIFALHTWQSDLFQPWQFITHMFMHDPNNWAHIIFNMFALWMFGSILENVWGQKRFLIFYFVAGLGAALAHMIALHFDSQVVIQQFQAIQTTTDAEYFIDKYWSRSFQLPPTWGEATQAVLNQHLNQPTVGASGAVFGCLAAFGYLFPNTYLYLYFLFPVKAKWFVLGYIALELFSTFRSSAGDNVAHLAHLGGALFGFLMVWTWNKRNRRNFY